MISVKLICIIMCVAFLSCTFDEARQLINHNTGLGIASVFIKSVYYLFMAILFGITFYGIHKRNLVAWKYGWIGFAILLLESLIAMVSTTNKLPYPDNMVASIVIVVGVSIGCLILGLAWKRQKPYFVSERR